MYICSLLRNMHVIILIHINYRDICEPIVKICYDLAVYANKMHTG